MTTRRQFVVGGALGALGIRNAAAQPRPPRVGMLAPFQKTTLAPFILQRLAELGYREGAGMVLEYRSADGVDDRYPKLARELIDAKCDVIFALGNPAARAFRGARSPVPVVFIDPDFDPLEAGLVDSLRRPGGNMTGVYSPAPALAVKLFEVALEVLPEASRFLVLVDSYSKDQLAALKKATDARRAQLIVVEYASPPYDFASAFETGQRGRAEAVIGLHSPIWNINRQAIARLIATYRIPAFAALFMQSEPGVLAAFGADSAKLARRVAEFGAQILKGAKPVDIPVEQPKEYELVVNLKTAKALGIKIPYSVLARATKVIE